MIIEEKRRYIPMTDPSTNTSSSEPSKRQAEVLELGDPNPKPSMRPKTLAIAPIHEPEEICGKAKHICSSQHDYITSGAMSHDKEIVGKDKDSASESVATGYAHWTQWTPPTILTPYIPPGQITHQLPSVFKAETREQLNQLSLGRDNDIGITRLSQVSSQFLLADGLLTVKVPSGNYEFRDSFMSHVGYYPDALDKPNQDSFCIHTPIGTSPNYHFFGVFDDHGLCY